MYMIPVRGPQTGFSASLGGQAKPAQEICWGIPGLGTSSQVRRDGNPGGEFRATIIYSVFIFSSIYNYNVVHCIYHL